jgi:Predicted aminopeptidases
MRYFLTLRRQNFLFIGLLLVIFTTISPKIVFAQSYKYANYCLDSLTSKEFCGRGYQYGGNRKAADFIKRELKNDGLTLLGKNEEQTFDISINNIHTAVLKLHTKDSALVTGEDYIVFGFSPSCDINLQNEKPLIIKEIKDIAKDTLKYKNKVLLLSQDKFSMHDLYRFFRGLEKAYIAPKLIIVQGYDKLLYPISTSKLSFPVIQLKGKQIDKKIDYLYLKVGSYFDDKYHTQNIWAVSRGTKYPDSMYVFVSHYDHLGMCGSAFFPGASDNASGTCVNMDLAKYYATHPCEYTTVFIFCSGEEIGLLGSTFAAENPLVDLKKIKFLVNLDMCGTGSGGLALINGQAEIKAATTIKNINDDEKLFAKITIGETSCNSDHCPFVQKGVPALFIFTYGCENNEYHTIHDTPDKLHFTKEVDLCNILKEFVSKYNR